MITLTLSQEEQDTLANLLDTTIDDFRVEIRDTDRSQYKEMLRHQRDTLLLIRQKLQAEPVLAR